MNDFLNQAIALGKPYIQKVAPNPAVGAILVKHGKIIGKGAYKNPYAGEHAEIQALKQAGKEARGATMYTSLEPCVWWKGKQTGSCAKALIKAKISKVVIGMSKDFNSKVNGRGVEMLKKAGIIMETHDSPEAKKVFAPYLAWVRQRSKPQVKPYVLLKTAMSVDGKIAAIDGGFVKFSNQQDKQAVHKLRASMDAILIGGHTLLWDNPKLTLRDKRLIQERIKNNLPAQPYKIAVIGNASKVNIKSRFFTYGNGRRIIFTTARTSKKKIAELKKVAYVYVSKAQKIDLRRMILICQKQGVRRILLEGGGTLHFNMLKAGLVDELRLAVAPIIIGGKNTPTLVDGEGFIKYPKLEFKKQEHFGKVKVFWYEIDKRKN